MKNRDSDDSGLDGEIDCAKLIGVRLGAVLLRAKHMGEGQPHTVDRERQPQFKFANHRVLFNVAARYESVAVEEQVSGDRARIDAGEGINTESARRFEEIAAGQRWLQ